MSFTKGDWVKRGNTVGVVDKTDTQSYGMMSDIAHVDRFDFPESWESNAHLIAAAGTAGNRAEEMGYDGRAAVEALPELIGALASVNQLIAEAATTGFNCHDGDWAERLFFSQQATSDALTKSKGGRG